MSSVSLAKIIDKMKLEPLTPEIDIKGIKIKQPDINRPALQLAGFFDHYEATRLQIIGFVEYKYMMSLSEERKEEIYTKLLSFPIPCIVFCREFEPDELFMKKSFENIVPLFKTKKT
ncbi:MAG: HPr(Ser) kinase/phosphatase, partial [Lachnospiraceae bacterium]|nr:HPr(Ser) kinase/phosphatase [Lachnospiraceae bacterium]